VFLIVGIPGLIVAVIMWFIIREPATVGASTSAAQPKRARWLDMFNHRNVPLSMFGAAVRDDGHIR